MAIYQQVTNNFTALLLLFENCSLTKDYSSKAKSRPLCLELDVQPQISNLIIYALLLHSCQGQLTLKQLRLSVLNEMHTNSYSGPRRSW